MGSSGMSRKGRRHLPKVPGHLDGPIGGFEHDPWTPAGSIERAGAFARGMNADSALARATRRRYGWAFVILVAAVVVLAVVSSRL